MKATELIKKHPIYIATSPQMQQYQYSYLGGLPFKEHVRKKRPSEDSNLWRDLIDNTVAQPLCRYIVDTINDVVFEPGVKREIQFATPQGTLINPETSEWSDLFLLDCDLQNRTLTSFMENVGDLTSIYGHCWIVVDMPKEGEGNLGRPYVVSVNPLDVWDWSWEYFGGKPLVKYVKIKEAEDEDNWYLKCYHLGDQTRPSYWVSYRVNKNIAKNDAEVIGQGNFPAGMAVPAFIAYGRRDPRSIDVGVSDIDAASDSQREHYKLECEAYTSIQFAKTIIRADSGIKIPVHAGAIVRATQGQVEAITVDLQDVDKIIKKQEDILNQTEALTGLGGIRNTKNQVASGVSIIAERKQLHRMAKSKARLMEVAEEMIFTFAARYMNMRWAGEVIYGTDYEAHDANYRMAVMKQAKELAPDNGFVDTLIVKEIIAMLAPDKDVQEYEQAYAKTIDDPIVRALLEQTTNQVNTRDLGNQIPTPEEFGEQEVIVDSDNAVGGVTAPIQDTGTSYETTQAIAVQIQGINTGR